MTNVISVGVIGLKPEDQLKFPNHKFGASIHFFDESLTQLPSLISFCNSMEQIFAFTAGIPSKAMAVIPKNKLFVLGGNSSAGTLVDRLEKKFGILERDDGGSYEPTPTRPLAINKHVPELPKRPSSDPYLIPLDWRRSIITGRTSQMRYPVQEDRLKVIEFTQGLKSDYSYLKAANPGDVVRYMNRPGEAKADVEHRAIYVMSNWPDRVGFDLEAHIHNDSIYYLITTVRRAVGQPQKPSRVLGCLREFREAMIAWENLKGNHKPILEVVEESAKGTVETTVVAVDESVEVPDSPLVEEVSGEKIWPEDWLASGSMDGKVRYQPGTAEPVPLIKLNGKYNYKPLIEAKPGAVFSFDYGRDVYDANAVGVAMRYPALTYASKCGHLIEGHVFGKQVILYVTDALYNANDHKKFVVFKDPKALSQAMVGEFKITGEAPANEPIVSVESRKSASTDVGFWKDVYVSVISRGDDNRKAKQIADQAIIDLNSL